MILNIAIFLVFFSGSFAFYRENSGVVELNAKNFDELVTNGKEIWLVEFFAPWCGHCQKFAADYRKIAGIFEGILKTGAVNADENRDLIRQYDIRGYPTIKIFNTHKGLPIEYEGDRTVETIVGKVTILVHSKINGRLDGVRDFNMFRSKDIVELTEENFEQQVLNSKKMWLIAYYASFDHRSEALSSEWAKVTSQLQGMINLGAVDAIINFDISASCDIGGYPTILFFPSSTKELTSRLKYEGDPESSSIIQWTLENIMKYAPDPKLVQIINLESLKEACQDQPLCLVSFIPQLLDCQSECRNRYLGILEQSAKAFKKFLWGWVWSEGGSQPEMETALEIGGFGYPAMVAVNVKKMKYSMFVGSFSIEGIEEFLKDLSRGKTKTVPITLTEMPKIEIVDSWDGLDSIVMSIESEDEDFEAEEFAQVKDEL